MLVFALIGAGAVWFVYQRGFTLYYGDAVSHLNIARRIVDSRTPGPNQLGTPGCRSPSAHDSLCAGRSAVADRSRRRDSDGSLLRYRATFLFAAAKSFSQAGPQAPPPPRFWRSTRICSTCNPAYDEPVFLACLMALLYFTVLFSRTQSMWVAICAGLAACAGTLARYEVGF